MRRAGRIALFLCAAVLLSAAGCGRREPDIDVVDGAEAPEEAVFPGESFTVLRTGRKYGRDGALSRAEHLRDLEMREALSVSPETETTESDVATAERYLTSAAAGEDRYTLVVGSLRGAGYPILCSGAAAEAADCPSLRFSRFPESLSAGGRRCLAVGALAPGSYGDAACVLMNAELARAFDVPLRGGEFTFDGMISAAAVIPTGTGLYRYAAVGDAAAPWIHAAGAKLTEDADGRKLVGGEPSGVIREAIRRAAGLFRDGRASVSGRNAAEVFAGGRALFLFCKTSDVTELRETGPDFIILPYPSLGRGATGYADSASGEAAAIPAAGLDGSRRLMISEYDRLSGKYVDAERRDALLAGRSAYDGESRETVDELLRGAEYELCEACGAGGLTELLNRAIFDAGGEIPREYAARAAAISAELRKAER